MKILMVSNSLPYPPHDGERARLLNIVRGLSQRHQISMISFIERPELAKYEGEIRPYCESLCTVLVKQKFTRLEKVICHLSMYPYSVVKRYSRRMEELVNDTIERSEYDIVHFDGLDMLPYGLGIRKSASVAFVTDAVSLYYLRNVACERHLLSKVNYIVLYNKMKRYESKMYGMFDKCIVVSETDKAVLKEHCPSAKLSVIPVGVDADYFRPTHKEEDWPSVMFSGNMDYPPNVHAVMWFVKNVLPLLKRTVANITVYIVGRNPSKEIDGLRDDKQIMVTGLVDDIRPYLDRATIFVCPMISGTGIKTKVLEAMAMEKAVIVSSLGVEGIPMGRDKGCLLLADTAEEFCDRITGIIKDADRLKELGRVARGFVIQHYNWKNSVRLLEDIYHEVVRKYVGHR